MNDYEKFCTIDDIAGLVVFQEVKAVDGEPDALSGCSLSLFTTWRKADPKNKKSLVDALSKTINDQKIDNKLLESYPEIIEKYSKPFLKEVIKIPHWTEKNL